MSLRERLADLGERGEPNCNLDDKSTDDDGETKTYGTEFGTDLR